MATKSLHSAAANPKPFARLKSRYAYQALMIGLAVILGIVVTHLLVRQLLVREALAEEAEFFWGAIQENPQRVLSETKNLRAFLLPRDADLLPDSAHQLTQGYHQYNAVDNFNVAYLSENTQGQRLLILFNRSGVDSLVLLFGILPLSIALVVLYTSLYLSYRFSIKLLSPAKYLADKIRRTDLRTIDKLDFVNDKVVAKYDEEISTIADAIGELADRIHLFVGRERDFTRDVSHELRSAITVMKMAVELLNVNDLTHEQKRLTDKINHAATDMEELTEFFLLLAREESRTHFKEVINVNQIVQQEIEKILLMTEQQTVPVQVKVKDECVVIGSEQVLSVLIGNLLRNALLYTKEGAVTVTIDNDKMIVKDTGVGISEDKMLTIFDCFERDLAKVKDNRPKGYGVGLSIVKRLCDRFSWRIELHSIKHQGTTISIYFQ